MIFNLKFTPRSKKDLEYIREKRKKMYEKVFTLMKEISSNPYSGTGHPEPLKNGNGIIWSRRINKKDRIVYEVYEDMVVVLVVQIGGHYSDK